MSSQEEGKGEKLVFIGDSGVGKTCIISRFIKGVYDNNVASTSGASYASKTIEISEIGKSITFDIWDTAGQERYKSLTKFFFQGAKMAVLVYDITRKESFDNLKNWLQDLREHGDPDIVLGIAGNKSDLYDEEAVSEQEARDYAKSIDAVFSLTSAQNNSGINELFKDLGRKYLEPNSKKIETSQPEQNQKPVPKPEKKEEPKNIKIGRKDVAKKNEEQKKKKGPC